MIFAKQGDVFVDSIAHRCVMIVQSIFQIIKLLLMIIVAFLLCWGPKLALRILQKLQLPFLYSEEAYIAKVRVGNW